MGIFAFKLDAGKNVDLENAEVYEPEPESTFHTVKSGDTLGAIAKEHLGSASRYPEIFEANK